MNLNTTSDLNNQVVDHSGRGVQGLRVVELDLNDPRLTDFVAAHPSGSVYHHPAWLRTLKAEYDRKILMLGCETPDGKLVGILPLVYTRGLGLPLGGGLVKARLSSLPRTPIVGPIGTSPEASRQLLRAATDRVSQQPGICLQIKTEGPLPDDVVQGLSVLPWRRSFVLPLPADPAELRLGSSGTERARIRWSVKKAQKVGLRVRMATGPDDLRRWYALYLETMRRITIPPRPLRFFLAMWKYLEPLGLMNMMIAERHSEGQIELIAGSIFLMHGKRVFYAFTACPAKHFSLRPHDLIQWEAIHWAAQNGYSEYDFGEVSDDDAQLASFKAKWGAEERLLYRYYYPEVSAKAADSSVLSSQQMLLSKVWQHIPLRATALIGDLMYSYL